MKQYRLRTYSDCNSSSLHSDLDHSSEGNSEEYFSNAYIKVVRESMIHLYWHQFKKQMPPEVTDVVGEDFLVRTLKQDYRKPKVSLKFSNNKAMLKMQGIIGKHIAKKRIDIIYATKIANLNMKMSEVLP